VLPDVLGEALGFGPIGHSPMPPCPWPRPKSPKPLRSPAWTAVAENVPSLFAVPEAAKAPPEPPRLGVRLDQHEGAVRIVDVNAGSLAERSGIKAGDRVVEIAGMPAQRTAQVIAAVEKTVAAFGGIDILVNNASAIQLTGTLACDMKRYDLMNGVDARGTYLAGRSCIPHLKKSANPHILTLSPPLDMSAKWFAPHVAYSMAKYGMSMCTLAWAEEFRKDGIAANSLWPRTTIATAAIKNLLGGDAIMRMSRTPEILAEAAYRIFQKPKSFTGNFLIDDTFLAGEGVSDFDRYRVDPSQPLQVDFFVPDDLPPPPGVSLQAKS